MRKIDFVNNEYYHIFNRGVDKRLIFLDFQDLSRFFQSMEEFNTTKPIGSIYENFFRKKRQLNKNKKTDKLVNFICYCLNPNHYHFILEQLTDKGIEKIMHKIGTGFTMFFNKKYNRDGSLFQGKFKAVHIDSNEYLLHLSAYVNLNNRIGGRASKISKFEFKSSWDEYIGKNNSNFCEKNIILEQFKNKTEYEKFALDSLKNIQEKKEMDKFL